ncbi:hypothetical protein DFH09DRAFT_1357693 [Mycena vulgaris]|nr:hypothetical protein DFH09DRAFT_1357693 [Mycena vulgaris]
MSLVREGTRRASAFLVLCAIGAFVLWVGVSPGFAGWMGAGMQVPCSPFLHSKPLLLFFTKPTPFFVFLDALSRATAGFGWTHSYGVSTHQVAVNAIHGGVRDDGSSDHSALRASTYVNSLAFGYYTVACLDYVCQNIVS